MECYHGTHKASTTGEKTRGRLSIPVDSLERTDCRSELRSCAGRKRRSSHGGKKSRREVELIDGNITGSAIGNKNKFPRGIDRDALR